MLHLCWNKRLLKICRRNNLVKHLIVAPILIISTWGCGTFLGLNIGHNVYDSVPYKWFVTVKRFGKLESGQYVVFQQLVNGKRALLVKEIVGVAGGKVVVNQDGCWVGEKYVGVVKNFSKNGKPLQSIKSGIIPEHYYFVAGESIDSFDSRYAEFGLVEESRILSRAFPLW